MLIHPEMLETEPLGKAVWRRLLHSNDGYSVTYMTAEAGPGAPAHNHPHAQFIYVLRGSGVLLLGDEEIPMGENQAVAVPPNIPHTFARFDTGMVWLEFFTPEREDIARR